MIEIFRKVESAKPAIRLDVSYERKKRLKESSRTIAVKMTLYNSVHFL